MLRTGQDYLDGWVLDYNFMKKHEALKGIAPAEYVGIDRLVPWGDSWEDITRMGGEIAEPKIKDVVTTRLKPGPKPQPGDVGRRYRSVPRATGNRHRQGQGSRGIQEAADSFL